MVRITTWNVNGIRNPFGYQPWREKRSFAAMFDILEADIVVLQELKIQRKDLTDDMVLVPGWDCFFSLPKHKKGYSGVAVYTRQAVCAPIRAEEGLLGVLCPPGSQTPYRDLPDHVAIGGYLTPTQLHPLAVDPAALDAEGRCLVLEFPAFVLFGVYSPANSNGLRDDFRHGFLAALDTRIRNLANIGKRVILAGDLNVSREELDTAKAVDIMRQEGITREDYLNAPNRRIFNQLLEHGKVPGHRDPGRERPVLWDLCRELHPEREGMFTHWEQKINARPGNFGSRIDYILCSLEMKSWFSDANIQEGLMGSDHCPVYATTKELVECQRAREHILDLMNPPGTFQAGVRKKDIGLVQDLLPLSGKLLPEFDRRRSIRDMFTKTPASAKTKPALLKTAGNTGGHSAELPNALESSETLGTSNNLSTEHMTSAQSPKVPVKRRSSVTSPIKSAKRSKASITASPSSGLSLVKGQQSLQRFFAPKSITASGTKSDSASFQSSFDMNLPKDSSTKHTAASQSSVSPTTFELIRDFEASEASKDSWTKLFSKKPTPCCEGHHESCISLTTKKPGINCGRQFWICSRPLGPSGQKEVGTEWRCGTFIWASDWNASSPGRE